MKRILSIAFLGLASLTACSSGKVVEFTNEYTGEVALLWNCKTGAINTPNVAPGQEEAGLRGGEWYNKEEITQIIANAYMIEGIPSSTAKKSATEYYNGINREVERRGLCSK